jgi:threonine/homoserine/homoserine lactone efflux protein
MTDPLAFTLAVLALLGTPGPTNTLLAASGAIAGFRPSLRLVAAELAGYALAGAALHLLLGDAVGGSAEMQTALRWGVGAYLAFTAFRLWRYGSGTAGGGAVTFRQVFVTTLLNPKAMAFAFVILPFTAPGAPFYLGAFAAMIVMAGTGWIAAGAWAGRVAFAGRPRLAPRISAVILAAFAAGVVAGG